MPNSCYLAPLQANITIDSIASSLASTLEDCPIKSVFESPYAEPSKWLFEPQKCAQELVNSLYTKQTTIFSGSFSDVPAGLDICGIHADVARHLRAPIILVIDAQSLDSQGASATAHAMAVQIEKQGGTPIASILLNASFTFESSSAHSPVIVTPNTEISAKQSELLAHALENTPTPGIPPLTYQAELTKRAKSSLRKIVLPEPEDDRVLKAAAQVLALEAAEIVIIGEESQISASAKRLDIDLSAAEIVNPRDKEKLARYRSRLAELRAKKGVTEEKAEEMLKDSAYFATMMIENGDADGMVSGACHTTANTIRPALQIIKTKPGVSTVSGAFLMLFSDHIDLYADCAVSINPNAAQLADIAISSAKTASDFGVEPKVALISYSTGDSGAGETVDKVKEATQIAKDKCPDLAIDGPLQFDAAVDTQVAAKKRPNSPVAGKANVFVFNHLDVGNCVYKAAQRTADAVAVGPVLQGLNKPVNDLSRGALVEDIVNTIIITAIQAQD